MVTIMMTLISDHDKNDTENQYYDTDDDNNDTENHYDDTDDSTCFHQRPGWTKEVRSPA